MGGGVRNGVGLREDWGVKEWSVGWREEWGDGRMGGGERNGG